MLPSGAISDSTPWIGFPETTMTRSGAPFHGETGEGSTVTSAASGQLPDAASAPEANAAASSKGVAATAGERAGSMRPTFLERAGTEPGHDWALGAGPGRYRIGEDQSAPLK